MSHCRPCTYLHLKRCRYGIISWFDPWHAYTHERTKFINALKPAKGNAIVYGGDTHAAFGAMLANKGEDYVGAEYSCPGVTSPDREDGSVAPLELHNAASLAASNVRRRLLRCWLPACQRPRVVLRQHPHGGNETQNTNSASPFPAFELD